MNKLKVPFKTPVDYFTVVLNSNYDNINKFKQLYEEGLTRWNQVWPELYDCDLHIYPYTTAQPAMLSMGCPNQCSFCPSAQVHKGKIHFGDPEIILSQYKNECIHFMDENFFYNDMKKVLPLLKKYGIRWLAMSDYKSTKRIIEKFSENYLYTCGLRIIEMGLENIVLYKKVQEKISTGRIVICYLNMTCLPGEIKESIVENAKWMKSVSLKRPMHFNNGVWYACGQFFYPYRYIGGGRYLEGELARVRPTWIPNTLLIQNYKIVDLEKANYYSQLVYGMKIYHPELSGNIGTFIGTNQNRATWMLSGIRCAAIR